MILTWLVPMAAAGLFGSAHCVGMCGGLIAVASDGAAGVRQRVGVQLSYQAARLASYVALGVVAGSIGHALDLAGSAAGLGKVAAVVAGLTMTLWGLWALLEAGGARLGFELPRLRLLPAPVLQALSNVRQRPAIVRAVLLGAVSALLPCGFLYAFAFAAAGTASPLGGALVMAALWLGNLPALLGFGLLVASGLSRVKRHIPVFSAVSVFALGLFALNSRMNLPAFAASVVAAPPTSGLQTAPIPSARDCPCHKNRSK